jgi:hypothetical protein
LRQNQPRFALLAIKDYSFYIYLIAN